MPLTQALEAEGHQVKFNSNVYCRLRNFYVLHFLSSINPHISSEQVVSYSTRVRKQFVK